MKQLIAVFVIGALLLAGCSVVQQEEAQSFSAAPESSTTEMAPANESSAPESSAIADIAVEADDPRAALPTPQEYIRQVVQETIDSITEPGMSEYEMTKAAVDYLIEIGDYQWPILLDIWRIRSDDSSNPSYVEIRACNFLLTGVGACEDYAAALVMLLEGMGMEARYLPGVTWGQSGGLIYHAWTQAKVDGVWYHIDAELTDGISTGGTVNYRYFLKSNATMRASHYWGRNFIDLGGLQPDQIEEITLYYLGEDCPQDYPTPAATQIPLTPRKDPDAYVAEVLPELEEYEALYGPLEYREFEVNPPVFGRYGGFRTSGITELSDWIFRGSVAHNLVLPPDWENR